MHAKMLGVLSVILALSLIFAVPISAQTTLLSGSLDPSFSGDGKLQVGNVAPAFDSDYRVKVQPDGKILTLSAIIDHNEDSRLIVHRFNPGGSLDSAFGSGGSVGSTFSNCCVLSGMLLLQPNGKIIVIGESAGSTGLRLMRYQPEGSLDSGFQPASNIKPSGYSSTITAALLLPSGKIVLAGTVFTATPPSGYQEEGILLVRLNTDGTLDTGFGNNGRAIDLFQDTDPSNAYSYGYLADIAAQTDGKLVVSAEGGSLRRYRANGSLEAVFTPPAIQGCAVCWRTLRQVAVQPDGKLIAAGSFFEQDYPIDEFFYLVRYNPDGSPDATFDGDGQVWTDLGNDYSDYAYDLTLQADGKIILAGSSGGGFALIRYLSNGSLDAGFGDNGSVLDSANGEQRIRSADLTADGKLMVFGNKQNAPGTLARYLLEEAQDQAASAWIWLPAILR